MLWAICIHRRARSCSPSLVVTWTRWVQAKAAWIGSRASSARKAAPRHPSLAAASSCRVSASHSSKAASATSPGAPASAAALSSERLSASVWSTWLAWNRALASTSRWLNPGGKGAEWAGAGTAVAQAATLSRASTACGARSTRAPSAAESRRVRAPNPAALASRHSSRASITGAGVTLRTRVATHTSRRVASHPWAYRSSAAWTRRESSAAPGVPLARKAASTRWREAASHASPSRASPPSQDCSSRCWFQFQRVTKAKDATATVTATRSQRRRRTGGGGCSAVSSASIDGKRESASAERPRATTARSQAGTALPSGGGRSSPKVAAVARCAGLSPPKGSAPYRAS